MPPEQNNVCPVCHQQTFPRYYFCPNCGKKLNEPPLSTSPATAAWIYAMAVILPMFLFIFITRWPAMKYLKSNDPAAKRIGQIALTLLVLSTIVTIWLAVAWTRDMIQSSINSINADLGF